MRWVSANFVVAEAESNDGVAAHGWLMVASSQRLRLHHLQSDCALRLLQSGDSNLVILGMLEFGCSPLDIQKQ